MAVGRELLAAAEAAEASLRYTVKIYVKCTSISVAPSLSFSLSLSLSPSLSLVWCGGFVSLLFSVAFAILSLWCGGVVSLLFLLMTLMSARYPQNCGVTAPL